MSTPTVTDISNGYRLSWVEEGIEVTVSRIHQHKDGRVTAEIFYTNLPKKDTEPRKPFLPARQVNLLSDRSLRDVAKTLEERWSDRDYWSRLVEQTAHYTLTRLREGEPSVEIQSDRDAEPQPLEYLLWPIIPKCKPVMLFGEGGTGKTQFAALLMLCVTLPWADNPFGLVTNGHCTRTLVLDWENEAADWQRLTSDMCRGLDQTNIAFRHRRCVSTFSDDLEAIQREVRDHAIDMVIIDSVGEACGGDLKEEEGATKLFRGLRSMPGVTPILIHHQSKTQDEKKKTPFGSAYFWNMSRSIWEIRHTQEPGEHELDIGIFHRKANFSERFKPIGLHFSYEQGVAVKLTSLLTVPGLSSQLSASTRILSYLKSGKANNGQISKALDLGESTVSMALTRLRGKGQVDKWGAEWGLV